jgi:excisionase family DNA binding protein
MENNNLPKSLTLKELCAVLNIGHTKGYELVRSKSFPVVRVGRAIRIPSEPYFAWLNNSTFY